MISYFTENVVQGYKISLIVSSWLVNTWHAIIVLMRANNSLDDSVLSFLDGDIRPPLKHESLNMANNDLWIHLNGLADTLLGFSLGVSSKWHESSYYFLLYWCYCPHLWITAQIKWSLEWSVSPLRMNRFTDQWAEGLIELFSHIFCLNFFLKFPSDLRMNSTSSQHFQGSTIRIFCVFFFFLLSLSTFSLALHILIDAKTWIDVCQNFIF